MREKFEQGGGVSTNTQTDGKEKKLISVFHCTLKGNRFMRFLEEREGGRPLLRNVERGKEGPH